MTAHAIGNDLGWFVVHFDYILRRTITLCHCGLLQVAWICAAAGREDTRQQREYITKIPDQFFALIVTSIADYHVPRCLLNLNDLQQLDSKLQ